MIGSYSRKKRGHSFPRSATCIMPTSQLETTLSLPLPHPRSHPLARPRLLSARTFSVLSPRPTPPTLPLYREISRAYKSSPTPHIIPANYSRKVEGGGGRGRGSGGGDGGGGGGAPFWDTGYHQYQYQFGGVVGCPVSGVGCRPMASHRWPERLSHEFSKIETDVRLFLFPFDWPLTEIRKESWW